MKFVLENWYLFVTALVSGAFLLWPLVAKGAAGADAVSPADAVTLINREKAVLIDVSEPAQYASGHPIGARSVPLESIEGSKELPKNKSLPVVVVCATGSRASRGVVVLKKLGFENARVLSGGVAAWRAANLPVERSQS